MIKSFKCKQTEKLYNKEFVKKFSGFARQAEKKLRLLDAAKILEDLSQIRGNRFELLIGDRQGQYSIRINDQWRICFRWNDAPYDVEIVDYHPWVPEMKKKFGDPIHPGEILADELEEIGISAATLAEKLDVPKNRIYQIINEPRSITADQAMRLNIFFVTTAEFWLNLQKCYELDVARQNADNLKHIIPYEPPKSNAVH